MPTWDSQQYLRFSTERTQPAIDLATRIAIESPREVIDLGCGPGNSTAVLAKRWPRAKLTGLDQSLAMVTAARASYPTIDFSVGDIATWTASRPLDVVFSNAALQWLNDHAHAFPRLLDQVAKGGAFAFQVPANLAAPGHQLLRDLGGSTKWQRQLKKSVCEWHVEPPEFYYDALAAHASRLDMWVTDYIHVLRARMRLWIGTAAPARDPGSTRCLTTRRERIFLLITPKKSRAPSLLNRTGTCSFLSGGCSSSPIVEVQYLGEADDVELVRPFRSQA